MIQSPKPTNISFRLYNPGSTDEAFIYSSWIKAVRKDQKHHLQPGQAFYHQQKAKVAALLDEPTTAVLMATHQDEPDDLIGWICVKLGPEPVIHYAYVKSLYRQMGIAKALVEAAGIDLTQPVIVSHVGWITSYLTHYQLVYLPGAV